LVIAGNLATPHAVAVKNKNKKIIFSSFWSDGEAHLCCLLSKATHAARSNLALCLALFLSSSTLLTDTIFYLDQAKTKTVPEAFYSPKPDLLKSLPSTIGFFHFGSTSDSSCS